jgi:hypothetical protein
MVPVSTQDIYEDQRALENELDRYDKKYHKHFRMFESDSLLSKLRPVSLYELYTLGKQLEQWDRFYDFCEDGGTLSQLGKIPQVAYDIITIAYGISPIAAIASVQTIDDERGLVYYKRVQARTTRGGVTSGQFLADSTQAPDAFALGGYSGDQLTQSLGNTAGGTVAYGGTLTGFPIRPQTVSVSTTVNGVAAQLQDYEGNGQLFGFYGNGTINYDTGAVTLTLNTDPAGVNPIIVTYASNFEAMNEIPVISADLESKPVRARMFALKGDLGLQYSFVLKTRFNLVAEEQLATDLISNINMEISHALIQKLNAIAQGNTNWSKTPPDGVSDFEHYQTFKLKVADAEGVLLGNAGRGQINGYVAGRSVAQVIGQMPGFVKLSDGSTIGPHIYGTLDGATVVRVPHEQVLDPDQLLLTYKAPDPFDAPVVYSPFMPLLVTAALPTGPNPIRYQKGAAVWAAVDSLVEPFCTRLTMTNVPSM